MDGMGYFFFFYLAINHTALFVHLVLVVIIDPISLKEDLILIRRYRSLIPICQSTDHSKTG